jgi:hypothetical protein
LGDSGQHGFWIEEVFQDVKQNGGIVFMLKAEVGVFEIGLLKIGIASLREALTAHHGIHRRPSIVSNSLGSGSDEFQHLTDMNANLGDIEGATCSQAFFAQKLVAKPVTKKSYGIANAFGFLGHSKFLASHD